MGSAAPVSVEVDARVATSSGTPFGLTIPLDTAVTASFTYETTTVDVNADESRGDYPHTEGGFTASLDGFATVITGSLTPFVQVEDLSVDTFRFIDGPRAVGPGGGTMAVNDVDDPDVELLISVSDGDGATLASDELPAPFPFGLASLPHTFSLADDQGSILLQVTGVTPVTRTTWSRLKIAYE